MDCPACQKKMSEENFGDVKVDICEDGCKGIWFDWLEINKLDETHEGLGQALKNALNSSWHKNPSRGRIICPKCQQPMVSHFYKSETMVTVDECYSCGGFFLDAGELEVLRKNHMGETQREEFLKTLLANNPNYVQAKRVLETAKVKNNPNDIKRDEAATKLTDMLTYFGK